MGSRLNLGCIWRASGWILRFEVGPMQHLTLPPVSVETLIEGLFGLGATSPLPLLMLTRSRGFERVKRSSLAPCAQYLRLNADARFQKWHIFVCRNNSLPFRWEGISFHPSSIQNGVARCLLFLRLNIKLMLELCWSYCAFTVCKV